MVVLFLIGLPFGIPNDWTSEAFFSEAPFYKHFIHVVIIFDWYRNICALWRLTLYQTQNSLWFWAKRLAWYARCKTKLRRVHFIPFFERNPVISAIFNRKTVTTFRKLLVEIWILVSSCNLLLISEMADGAIKLKFQ